MGCEIEYPSWGFECGDGSNGGLVTELVNASIQPGHYSVDWNAVDYASGIYFVKMIAGDYMQNQKLMLVK
tara:strand:+ start:1058 stop:1267 length:210 start_codon:yes stop_codon:yes gene_type:complete